jgi:hypothetical protein
LNLTEDEWLEKETTLDYPALHRSLEESHHLLVPQISNFAQFPKTMFEEPIFRCIDKAS